MSMEPPTEPLGMEGETCAQCGAVLATDQRYCLNCGTARTEPRLDFQKHLSPTLAGAPAAAGVPAMAGGPAAAGAPAAMQQVSPITAIFAIALLGVMLLLGVLIGKDDDATTVAAAPAATAAVPTTTAPTDTTAAVAPTKTKEKGAGAAPGQGDVVQGATGVAAADTSASPLENAKNGPDVVATQGEKEQLDPGGESGAGSDAVCIGC
jgi:hypothetical protein